MTWLDQIQVWEINNPDGDYFENVPVIAPAVINRETLFDFLIDECGTFQPIWGNSERFREEITIFFLTHMWNIEELAKTMQYDYDPLSNRNWTEHIDTTDTGNKNTSRDTHATDERDITTSSKEDHIDVHYVSAFNQNETVEGESYDDVEDFRDAGNVFRSGNDKDVSVNNVNVEGTETTANVGDKDIVHKGNDGTMYQDYVTKQRRVVEFNLYNWICDHFAEECFSHIW